MLEKQRAMPWQQALNEPQQQAEAVYVVAGTGAGMLHVWVASGAGQHTWRPIATPQQVISDVHCPLQDSCTSCQHMHNSKKTCSMREDFVWML